MAVAVLQGFPGLESGEHTLNSPALPSHQLIVLSPLRGEVFLWKGTNYEAILSSEATVAEDLFASRQVIKNAGVPQHFDPRTCSWRRTIREN